MKPLRVTAVLAGEVAGDIPMLDSLLEYCMSRRMRAVWATSNGHRHYTRLINGNVPEDAPDVEFIPGSIPIPIRRNRMAGFPHMIPCASSPIFVAESDRHAHYARRFDVDPAIIAPDERRVFQSSGGEFKSYRLPLRVRLTNRVVWFCVGRGTEIRRLLRDVRNLGKKTSQGWGRVAEWIVEPVENDLSWFADSPAGRVLMRPLPSAPPDAIGLRKWYGGIIPPYWAQEYFAEGVTPC